ncbi:MAG TPA: hypothetical protein VKB81_11115, partial [Nitrospira sp.]|nr:hypothetical protein [Nitrospira sp.]
MAPTNLPPPHDPTQRPPSQPGRSEDQDSGSDQHMRVIAKMVGTAFMFLGFLQIFLSISGGFELSGVVALLLYFGGLAIWANAVIEQPMLRWGITVGAIGLS